MSPEEQAKVEAMVDSMWAVSRSLDPKPELRLISVQQAVAMSMGISGNNIPIYLLSSSLALALEFPQAAERILAYVRSAEVDGITDRVIQVGLSLGRHLMEETEQDQ